MNDAEFIELLNLYLDHEISAVDARRLEAEVTRNPARYKIYREYCQMQKACVVLAQASALETAATAADANVVSFDDDAPRWGFGFYAAAACAAVACVAVVAVMRNGNGSANLAALAPEISSIASTQFTPVSSLADKPRDLPRTVSVAARNGDMKPAFAAYTPRSITAQNSAAGLDRNDARFEWMQGVQVSAMPRLMAEDLRFDQKANLAPDKNNLRNRRPIDARFEQAAHQFQR
jgi:anti-sigma factor RsiW